MPRKPKAPEPVTYRIKITSWGWGYFLHQGRHAGLVDNFRHLTLDGRLVPRDPKITSVVVEILPDFVGQQEAISPSIMGMISRRKGEMTILQTIHADALSQVLVMLTSGHLRSVHVTAQPEPYRSWKITEFSLRSDDPTDL